MRLAASLAALALALSAGPAWADTIDVSALLKDGGPWGMVTVCCSVIAFLWFRTSAKDDEIKALNKENGELRDRRGNEADARAERFASVVTSSVATGEKLIAAVAGVDGRTKDIGEVVAQLPALCEATLKALDRNADKIDRAFDSMRGPRL